MEPLDPVSTREAEFTHFANSEMDRTAFRAHVSEILRAPAFRGSHRSRQFLKYIVDQSLAGHFDLLKERSIGVELFGRSPSYDTGQDAIVRVTANVVRRHLAEFYLAERKAPPFRLSLPLGSYIPEVLSVPDNEETGAPSSSETGSSLQSVNPHLLDQPDAPRQDSSSAPVDFAETTAWWHSWRIWLLVVFVAGLLFVPAFLRYKASGVKSSGSALGMPWQSLFRPNSPVHLIASDKGLVVMEEVEHGSLGLTDYAEHKYVIDKKLTTPEVSRYRQAILDGDSAVSAVDLPIITGIAALVAANGRTMDAKSAHNIQLSDLKTNDSLILLGSARSNPWVNLYDNQLDFTIVYDKSLQREVVINRHPRPGEALKYIPAPTTRTSGQSYAIIAFLQNPDTSGQVLLLSGASSEGTSAAGEFVTNLSKMPGLLRACAIDPAGPAVHFEILLSLSRISGLPNNVEIVACHKLDKGAPGR
ncbi:MAG: hypothetical protein P4K83_02765 [Terracidiphilus sp.]|nr:hypothetical protein [Terracidiphilus sp.]